MAKEIEGRTKVYSEGRDIICMRREEEKEGGGRKGVTSREALHSSPVFRVLLSREGHKRRNHNAPPANEQLTPI